MVEDCPIYSHLIDSVGVSGDKKGRHQRMAYRTGNVNNNIIIVDYCLV